MKALNNGHILLGMRPRTMGTTHGGPPTLGAYGSGIIDNETLAVRLPGSATMSCLLHSVASLALSEQLWRTLRWAPKLRQLVKRESRSYMTADSLNLTPSPFELMGPPQLAQRQGY
jgi:hypothetical protein